MKLSPLLLAGSLAANVGLVVYILRTPRVETPSASTAGTIASAPGSPAPKPSAPTAPPTAAEIAAVEKIWSEHASDDPATMVARLHAANISPAALRAYLATRRSQWPPAPSRVRPANPRPPASTSPTVLSVRAELTAYERKRYGDLSPEKINQVKQVEADYNDLIRNTTIQASGTILPEDREKLAYLEREKLADLAKVLTPAELDDYLIRTSPLASGLTYLRDQTVGFHATEDEYRAIVRATIAADTQFGGSTYMPLPLESWRQRNQAVTEQLAKVLSPERFADYQRASDPSHRALDALATRLELPATTADQVLALESEFRARAVKVRVTPSLDPAARAAQLADLSEEADRKLTAVLTPRGLEAYKANATGFRLRAFLPAPPVPPKP